MAVERGTADRRRRIVCLLDSSAVIDFLRDRKYVSELLLTWRQRGLLAISVLTECEVYQGLRREDEAITEAFLEGMTMIPVSRRIARRAGLWLNERRREGRPVAIIDSLIAATALTLDVPLISNDIGHYQFPGLKVIPGR